MPTSLTARLALGLAILLPIAHSATAQSTGALVEPDAAALAKLSNERPWQTNDGIIHFQGRRYTSWRAYFDERESRGSNDHRCAFRPADAPAPDAGTLLRSPADCSCSSNNPSEEYDPSVGVLRVPCVVHVIRNSSGTQGDIPLERVISGIRILNEDFQARSGTNGANGNNANIEFYLAEVDPDGNPTNGVTFSNNDTWYNDGGSYWNSLNWDPSRYMNIYTTTAGGNLGYVPFLPACGSPGSASDRVVVLWESYGEGAPIGPPYNLGRTLTHEVGHYLGLNHTFNGCEGGNCNTGGDLICDTSPQNSPTFGCNGSSCSGVAPDDNYMDYSDDVCMEQFTPFQNRRMRCTLEYYRTDLTDPIVQLIQLEQVGVVPALVPPSGLTAEVRITELQTGGLVPGSPRVVIDTGSGEQSIPLASQGGGLYAAQLSDLPCGNQLDWYFTAEDSAGLTRRLPASGAFSAPIADGIDQVADLDFDASAGWTAETTATAGGWERGVPTGDTTSVDVCSAPGTDSDGSGSCWLTGNGFSQSACANDIDGGNTILTSAVYQVTEPTTEVRFSWWYDNTSANNTEYDDVFIVEVSGDSGTSWTSLLTVSNGDSAQNGWTTSAFRIRDYVSVTSGFRIRFIASDQDPGSVVEAGVDAFSISAINCGEEPACEGDVNGDDEVTGQDLAVVLSTWAQTGPGIPGDLNGDLVVNGSDIALVLGNWGPCTGE